MVSEFQCQRHPVPSQRPIPLTLPSVNCQICQSQHKPWTCHDRRRYREILTLQAFYASFFMRARGFFDVRVSLCLTRLVCCANTNQVHSVETMLSWYKLKIQRAVSPLVLARSMKDDAPLVRNVGNIEKRGRSNISSRCISRILSCQCWSRKWRPVFTWLRSSKRCGELFDEWWTNENHDDATTLGRLGMFTITWARYQHGCAYLIYFSILSIIVTIVTASQERKVL